MAKEPTLNIAIIGAGITGLTTAIALRKLPGIDVQVYERAPELRELGQAIALNPNGLRTLEKLGVESVFADNTGFRCVSGVPQTVRHWKTNEVMSQEKPKGNVEDRHMMTRFYRPDLQETLLEYLPREIIHLGKSVVGVNVKGDEGVDVEFADGQIVRVDLLVGADGLRSSVRGLFVPDFELKWSGLIAYRSAFDVELLKGVEDLPEDTTQWWSSKDGLLTTRMGRGKYGIVAFRSVDPTKDQHLLERTHWDEIGDVEITRDMYKDFHPLVQSIIAAVPHVRTYPNFYGGFLDTYAFGGRVVLVGDAAHSHGGALAANSSLGIDDAYCLCLSLRESFDGGNPPRSVQLKQALNLYDATRRPHAERVLKVACAMYDGANHRLWNQEPETDEMLRERAGKRPDGSWIHEYDVEAAFERTRGELQNRETGFGEEVKL